MCDDFSFCTYHTNTTQADENVVGIWKLKFGARLGYEVEVKMTVSSPLDTPLFALLSPKTQVHIWGLQMSAHAFVSVHCVDVEIFYLLCKNMTCWTC